MTSASWWIDQRDTDAQEVEELGGDAPLMDTASNGSLSSEPASTPTLPTGEIRASEKTS